MIHVCFCFRDKTGSYAKFAGLSMFSLLENTDSPVTVHILHDNTLTPENRDKFSYLAGRYGQIVKFYNLDVLCADKIAEIINLVPNVEKTTATVGTFYKILIPQVLPKEIDKAIFIDPDTIVNLDISELWHIDLGDKYLGAVTEKENGINSNKSFLLCSEGTVNAQNYFNCGVLLMNLNSLRKEEEKIMQGIQFRGKNPQHKYLEQTVLNYCFSEHALKLPLKFNTFVRRERSVENPSLASKIYHYGGNVSKPRMDTKALFNRLWLNSFAKSPWFDAEIFGRLYTSFQKVGNNNQKDLPLNLVKVMPGKTRTFFVEPDNLKSVTETFSIKDYEEVILAENADSVKKLIDTMKTCKGTSVFFIMTETFLNKNFPFDRLTKEGFKENKDFFKGWTLTPDAQNISFDSYPLINAM